MASKVKFIPANTEMVIKYYGERPKVSFKAIAGVCNDEVLGIGGFFIYKSCLVMFSNLTDKARKHYKLSLIKGIRRLLETVRESNLPIYSICDPNINNADKLLKHIGFNQLTDEVYQWDRSRVH